ncbi:glycyl-radical enzyme activating protein [Vallitalea pronyensis]|uniref:Glycyl-radical enzyme activating protein n=1 Tax=Vallitalea pronyensis TaxID=1348613 RepID=A0A8J8SJA2_9FIRM|nr:glycyl-radical enzyme activating protein [Vallitalea pronyensis]QUI25274.1 glycyl-radical enzyme activating protein [Vallitalea pronyensis]
MKGIVFDIQKCSIHDGPGIRTTVFLKGCPLRCQWCHNPESQSMKPQLRFMEKKCINCQSCAAVCNDGVHVFQDGRHHVNYDACTSCGRCVEACPTKALSITGKYMTVDDVIAIVKKDIPFYEHSGGGVTISGGEPLLQSSFTRELLIQCQSLGIHTCVETSGYGSDKQLEEILPYTDLFLFDYKVSNDERAVACTGVDTSVILRHLDSIIRHGNRVILRCPIIPSVNDDHDHYDAIIALLKKYPSIEKAELMAYHNIGLSKGHQVGIKQKEFSVMSDGDKALCLQYFRDNGVEHMAFSS